MFDIHARGVKFISQLATGYPPAWGFLQSPVCARIVVQKLRVITLSQITLISPFITQPQ
jgi:hypothetical protein